MIIHGNVQQCTLSCPVLSYHCIPLHQVRHRLNEYLAQYAGHIGYSVRPDERRKGVAKWMLRESLDYCRALGLEKVMVACLPDNEGSRRTILANGGVYERTVFEPDDGELLEQYWITL